MPTLVFDIETIGENFDELDETTQEALTRWAKKGSKSDKEYKIALEDIKDGLGFSPWTGEIVAIGVFDSEKKQGAVYYQAPGEKHEESEEGSCKLKAMSEKEMLKKFWELAEKYDQFVSFNGRGFDVPYLVIRSMKHKVKPSKDLMSNRYLSSQRYGAKHIDLLDQLSFYGAVWKKPSLHLCCRTLGIESPKTQGVCGDDVAKLFKEKKFLDIARYNVRDIVSTDEVYEYWRDYLNL